MTFIAHLQPSRQDVPEYVEYLEKIEALVAVINHRHGTTDWMPIDLRLRDDFEEAVALYKHFDLLLVNAMWDGMNLVSKEGPLVNTRNGMMILSENTGAHEELGDVRAVGEPLRRAGAGGRDVPGADRHAGGARAPHAARCGTIIDVAHAGGLDRRPARRHRRQERRLAGKPASRFESGCRRRRPPV